MNHVTTYICQSLHDIYPPGELRSLTKIICCDLLGQDAIDYYLGKDITLSANEQCDLESIVERLKKTSRSNIFRAKPVLWVYVSGSSGCVDSSS